MPDAPGLPTYGVRSDGLYADPDGFWQLVGELLPEEEAQDYPITTGWTDLDYIAAEAIVGFVDIDGGLHNAEAEIDRRDLPAPAPEPYVPVGNLGPDTSIVFTEGESLSPVVSIPALPALEDLPPPPTWGGESPEQEIVQDLGDDLVIDEVVYTQPTIPPPVTPGPVDLPPPTGPIFEPEVSEPIMGDDMADLGDWDYDWGDVFDDIGDIIDIGDWWDYPDDPGVSPAPAPAPTPSPSPAPGGPMAPPTALDPYKGLVWNPRANCGQGKWVRCRRKRRSRLATVSDIKDLAALKSVLGNGKAFETWIATHS